MKMTKKQEQEYETLKIQSIEQREKVMRLEEELLEERKKLEQIENEVTCIYIKYFF